jgi:uncharacterized protein YaiE (UPF0345 family)
MSEFNNVRLVKKSNIYFDGKCVSHTLYLEDGSRKTVGVIFPSTLVFNTDQSEVMEVLGGHCRVRLRGQDDWVEFTAGQSFQIASQSGFEIETLQQLDYVCHFGD